MPGTFSKSNRPERPGAYVNFSPTATTTVPASAGSVAAVLITHDWGPSETVARCVSFSDFQAQFGSSDDTAGYRAVRQAFTGEGLPGRGGASEVLVWRAVAASAAKADAALLNTAGSPVTGLTLTAKYDGTRGDDLKVTIQDNAANGSNFDLILKDGTVEVERYTLPDENISELAAEINLISDWVTAAADVDNVSLAEVSNSAFSGGDDGTSLLAGDYTAAFDALEVYRFGVFAAENLTDPSITASLVAWVDGLNAVGKSLLGVIGGAAAESVATAVTRATTANSPYIVCVGVGSAEDSTLGTGETSVSLGTAELAPRIAGILCSRGETQSITFARLANLSITAGATEAQILTAFDAGLVVLSRDSHSVAPVRIEKGLTTFTTTDDLTRPYLIYRNPKFVRTMQGVQQELAQWSEENVIGILPINDTTREYVVGHATLLLKGRAASGAIQETFTVQIDQNPPPSDNDEFIGLVFGISFGRSLEQLYFSINIS